MEFSFQVFLVDVFMKLPKVYQVNRNMKIICTSF